MSTMMHKYRTNNSVRILLIEKNDGLNANMHNNNDTIFHIHKMPAEDNDDWFFVRMAVKNERNSRNTMESYAMQMPDLMDWLKHLTKAIQVDTEPVEAIQIDYPILPTTYLTRSMFLLNSEAIADSIRYALDWVDTDDEFVKVKKQKDDSESDSDSSSDSSSSTDSSEEMESTCCSSEEEEEEEEEEDDSDSDYSEESEETEDSEELEEEEYTVHRNSCEKRHNRILNYRECEYDEEESAEESDDSDDSDYEPPAYVKKQVAKHTKYDDDGTLRTVTHKEYINKNGKWVNSLLITARRQ